jgi:hypothetical protein
MLFINNICLNQHAKMYCSSYTWVYFLKHSFNFIKKIYWGTTAIQISKIKLVFHLYILYLFLSSDLIMKSILNTRYNSISVNISIFMFTIFDLKSNYADFTRVLSIYFLVVCVDTVRKVCQASNLFSYYAMKKQWSLKSWIFIHYFTLRTEFHTRKLKIKIIKKFMQFIIFFTLIYIYCTFQK